MKDIKLKDALVSLIFPRRCPICDKPVKPYGALACAECEKKVMYVSEPACFKCGKPLRDATAEYCDDCKKHRHLYVRGLPLFDYRSVSDSIYRFKYQGRSEYAAWYGEKMYSRLGNRIKAIRPDALIPVPIHKSKLRQRGYNQAALLARELSERTGIPVREDVVVRAKKTDPLKDHTPAERNNILRGAFKLASDDVKLKTIIIVDDIYTTGATVDEIASVCMAAGAGNVYYTALSIGRGV